MTIEPPDYSETLGQLTKLATATYQRAEILRKAAEEETVPRQVAARVTGAVAEDRQAVKTAAGELRDATRALQGITASARRGDEQNRWLVWTAIGGIIVGMILWAVFAGIVARPCRQAGTGRKGWRHARSPCRCGRAGSA